MATQLSTELHNLDRASLSQRNYDSTFFSAAVKNALQQEKNDRRLIKQLVITFRQPIGRCTRSPFFPSNFRGLPPEGDLRLISTIFPQSVDHPTDGPELSNLPQCRSPDTSGVHTIVPL